MLDNTPSPKESNRNASMMDATQIRIDPQTLRTPGESNNLENTYSKLGLLEGDRTAYSRIDMPD
jgi:hypothetical protein